MRHTVILSDVHLCEAVPGDDLWMRYRQRRFFPDDDFARLFDTLCAEARGDAMDLVFNGDLFDFDAPAVIDGKVIYDDPPRSEPVAVAALRRILDDHAVFVAAVARVVDRGHTVTFISGNHDAQLTWPALRELLTARIVEAVATLRGVPAADVADAAARVRYRAWIHRTDDGIHIEHGNQYDKFCAFRYPMEPFTEDGREVQPTMGSLSFRHLVSRMGYFNPHVDRSFMLSLPDYLKHWARYYLFSRRSLGFTWARGALTIAARVFTARDRPASERAARNLIQSAVETGCDPEALAVQTTLFAPPSCESFHAVTRELWLDRVAVAGLGVAALALAVTAAPVVGGTCAGLAIGALAAYEVATPKVPLSDTYAHMSNRAREVARLHNARAVVFGHTHEAHGMWENGVFFGNTGTWSAAFLDVECTQPVENARPVVWLRSDARGELSGGLYQWRAGMLLQDHASAPRQLPARVPPRESVVPPALQEALAG